jgi:hypothetical protein
MPCEKYQEALTDLAATGVEPNGGLRTHLNGCASCREVLRQDRSLFSAIDASVRQLANAQVPPSLIPRLHERLTQEAMRRSATIPAWTLVTATALIVVAVWLVRVHSPKAFRLRDRNQATAGMPSEPNPFVERSVAVLGAVEATRSRAIRSTRTGRANAVTVDDPEVLVPPDEGEAFARFLSDLNGRQDVAEALVKPLTERLERNDPVQTPEIETAELVVGPLDGPHDE